MPQLRPIVVGHKGYWGSKLYQKLQQSDLYRNPIGWDIKDFHNGSVPYHNTDAEVAFIATPTETHLNLAMGFIMNSIPVLVEKPMTKDLEEAKLLSATISEGSKGGVDHTFLFDTHIRTMKQELFNNNMIGSVQMLKLERYNLGKFNDYGVILDLAPHDLAILDFFFDKEIPEVASVISSCTNNNVVHTTDIVLLYGNKTVPVTLSLSWLFPKKIRRTVVVGTEGMATYDMLADNPLVITDKKAWAKEYEWQHKYMWDQIYKGPTVEPLMCMVNEFARYVTDDVPFLSDLRQGYRVMKIINEIEKKQQIVIGA